jgi:cation-transporting P-type ATPase 13A2
VQSDANRQLMRSKFGYCLIAVPKKTVLQILISEVLNPFYIFQVFSMIVFVWEDYTLYACCIFVLSATSIIVTIFETRRNNETIRKMARYVCPIELASGKQIWSDELVPGDVIKVPSNVVFPCDLILLKGSAIVNESILTGESIPVIK